MIVMLLYLLTGSKREQFRAVRYHKVSVDVYSSALKFLCEILHDYHKKSAVVFPFFRTTIRKNTRILKKMV